MSVQNLEEIKCWLKPIFEKKNISDFSVKILGGSEKGDGYLGDIVFVEAEATLHNKTTKTFNFVLKCSKRSQILRETVPVKETFLNEIYVYDKIFPAFYQFQREKGIEAPFDSIPKYYGHFTNNMEILVLKNLKKSGYVLCNKEKPLTRNHIDLVVEEYAKFHAISVALREQNPEIYEKLVSGLIPTVKKFMEKSDIESMFGNKIDQAVKLLENEIDEKILLKWKRLRQEIKFIFEELLFEEKGLKVITHGDCWTNNLMFKHKENNENLPLKAALLDWQLAMSASPATDLSHFLFACISSADIEDLDDILHNYYKTFSNYLQRLGNNSNILYPHDQFLAEWKKYCKYGLVMAPLIFYVCSTDKEEVIDILETAEKGQDVGETFAYELKDNTIFKNRMSFLMKYTVNHNIL